MCDWTGDPIITTTGEYVESRTDLHFRSRGFNFGISRSYGAQSSSGASMVGYGWHVSVDTNVDESGGSITLNAPDGKSHTMASAGGDTYTAEGNAAIRMVKDTGSTSARYKVNYAGDPTFEYDSNGYLQRMVDESSNAVTFTYSGGNAVTRIADATSRTVDLAYDGAGTLTRMVDYGGRVVSYHYSGGGDLTRVEGGCASCGGGGVVDYTYSSGFSEETDPDLNHNILTGSNGNGDTAITNYYDESDRVTKQDMGPSAENASYILYYDAGNGQYTHTDLVGNEVVKYFDEFNRLTREAVKTNRNVRPGDPAEYVTAHTYSFVDVNGVSHLSKETESSPGGMVDEQWYDAAIGLVTRKVRRPSAGASDADSLITDHTYTNVFGGTTKEFWNTATEKNRRGYTTTYYYDANAQVVSKVFPTVSTGISGTQTAYLQYACDANGLKTREVDGVGVMGRVKFGQQWAR